MPGTCFEGVAISCIDASTLKAYRETEYGVEDDAPFYLSIGRFSEPLARLQARHGVDCSAYLTACNPFGRLAGAGFNARRQRQLADDLRGMNRLFLSGAGRHPNGTWPPEPSFLVLGLTRGEARALGDKYEQNAVVCCGPRAVPRLVLLR